MHPFRQIDERRVQYRADRLEQIRRQDDFQKHSRGIQAVKCDSGEDKRIQQLTDERRTIVAQPKHLRAWQLVLDEMVSPHVMKLADNIRDGRTRHDSRHDAEQRLQRLLREIAFTGREKQRERHENRQRQHADETDERGQCGVFFRVVFR